MIESDYCGICKDIICNDIICNDTVYCDHSKEIKINRKTYNRVFIPIAQSY